MNNRDKNGRFNGVTMIEYNGKSQPLTAWAREMGLNPDTLRHRLFDFNWPVEEALTRPSKRTKHRWQPCLKVEAPKRKQPKPKKSIKLCNIRVCKKCKYHDGGRQQSDITCGYITYHPSHKRRPCPAGKCTVFEPMDNPEHGWKADRDLCL